MTTDPRISVELLVIDGCPNTDLALERLKQAATINGDHGISVEVTIVDSTEQAEQLSFAGSPTFLIDGNDPFSEPNSSVGLSCRLYRTTDGLTGCPSIPDLARVLRDRSI